MRNRRKKNVTLSKIDLFLTDKNEEITASEQT